MEILSKLAIITIIVTFFSAFSLTTSQFLQEEHDVVSPSPAQLPPPSPPQATVDPLSATHFFSPVLTHLGFHQLAIAVPSISPSSSSAIWNGPFTVFAPSDSSIHTCVSCAVPRILQEHIVPGVFSFHYLQSLSFGTKIETIVPGRCVTVTSALNGSKIFVGGVEIARPDLFNNGLFVVHGLEGYVAHLSPFSCNIERMTSLSFSASQPTPDLRAPAIFDYSMMRFMISDAMLRLRITGFSILALAFKVKYAELVTLQNMTVSALDDDTIFSGGQIYVSNIRLHIVPNRMLTIADLERLPVGTVLPTLDGGQNLVVTSTGGGLTPMRINYVRVKIPNLMLNLKIVVHGVFLPFPHIHSTVTDLGAIGWPGFGAGGTDRVNGNTGSGLGGIGRPGFDAEGTDHVNGNRGFGQGGIGRPGFDSQGTGRVKGNTGFNDVSLAPEYYKSNVHIEVEDHHGL